MAKELKRKIYLSGPMSGWERADYVRRFREALDADIRIVPRK